MIRLDQTEVATGLTPRSRGVFPLAPEPPAPTTGEVLGAAFALENDVVNALSFFSRRGYGSDADPDAWMQATGWENSKYQLDYSDRFVGVTSEREARSIMTRIDTEERQRSVLSRGGWRGVLGGMAAGVISPTSLVPVAGWYAGAGRAARAAGGAIGVGIGAAAQTAAQELLFQNTQELRTTAESVFNIAGAAVMGGVLGGAAGALTRSELSTLGRSASRIPATAAEERDAFGAMVGGPASAGAAATDAARGTGELAGALGAERAFSFQDPLIRLQTNELQAARNTVRDLAETPLTLAENAEGIATTLGGSVETRAKMAQGPMTVAIQRMDEAFQDYFFGGRARMAPLRSEIRGLAGRAGGKLTYTEFKRAVDDAMIAGDVHPIPQVQAAAASLRQAYDRLAKEAIDAGVPGFKEAVEAFQKEGLDAGYVYRVYNREAITANRARFVEVLTRYFVAKQGDLAQQLDEIAAAGGKVDPAVQKSVDMTPDEIRSVAEETTATILGLSPTRMAMPGDIVSGPRGPLKERVLRIPTELVKDFIERDPEVKLRMATRTMATDAALVRKFGSVDMTAQIAKINDEAARAIAANPERSAKITKAQQAAIRDVTAIRDRLRGNYALPTNPEGLAYRASKVLRNLNYVRLLGGMTLSAIPDIARPVFAYGLGTTLKTLWHPLTRGLKNMKLAAGEVKLAGTALDMVLDSRTMALADIMDDFGRGSKFERGLTAMSGKFGVVSLMAPWNATLKQFAGIIAQTKMLQTIEKLVGGKASRKEVAYLAAGGVDANVAERIASQFSRHGQKDGAVWWANTSEWTDQAAADSYRAFLVRDVDKAIITPGQDKPLWMSTGLGKLIGQFKSFAVASVQRTIIAGLQQRDMAALNGALMMLGLGAITYAVKETARGATLSDDPAKWAVEAFDYSGLAGWLMEANNMAEKVTRGRIGASALTGEVASRYASRNALGAAMGPSFDLVGDILQVVGSASAGDWQATDTHTLRKLLPLQNLFYLRQMFDKAESGLNGMMGVRAN